LDKNGPTLNNLNSTMNLPLFVIGLPIYTMLKKMKIMENGEKLYEFEKVGKNVEVMNIPEGKIYMIDTEGNGSGKRPIFVSKKENADFEGMINKVLEALKQLLSKEPIFNFHLAYF